MVTALVHCLLPGYVLDSMRAESLRQYLEPEMEMERCHVALTPYPWHPRPTPSNHAG